MTETIELKTIHYNTLPGADPLTQIDRIPRLEYAKHQKCPHLPHLLPCSDTCAIVGAGPSIGDSLDKLRKIKEDPNAIIMSVNGAHNFLINHGIIPNIHVLFEIDLETVEDSTGGEPHKQVYYYVCSHSCRNIFHQLKHYHKVIWHYFDEDPEYQRHIMRLFPGEFMVQGGYMTFFRSLTIATVLGYRNFEIFGCDASFEGETAHFDGYHNTPSELPMDVLAGTPETNRKFRTLPSLSFMATEFINFCDINHSGVKMKVHGDNMLRYLHQMRYPECYTEGV